MCRDARRGWHHEIKEPMVRVINMTAGVMTRANSGQGWWVGNW
jgi:hypothetical protein